VENVFEIEVTVPGEYTEDNAVSVAQPRGFMMLNLLQNIFPFAFPILWLGGAFILALRWRSAQKTYFKRLEPEIPELKNNPRAMRLYLPNYAPVYTQLRQDMWNAMRYPHSNTKSASALGVS